MRGRFWIPCLGLALLGAAACSLAIGKADLSAVRCEQEGQQGAPSCDEGQICLQGVCTDCGVAGICGAAGTGGVGGEGGTGGTGGTGGDEAGVDANQGGSAGTGGATHDGGTGGTTEDVVVDPGIEPPPDVVQEPPEPPRKLGESCTIGGTKCETGLFCSPPGAPFEGVCSKSCCTSSDSQCAAQFVCIPASAGGMCVEAVKLGLKLGVALPTISCTKPEDCRSGRCDMSGGDGGSGRCIDMCCSDGDCSAGGGNCAFLAYGSTPAWQCTVWPSGHTTEYPDSCGSDGDCKSGSCVTVIGKVCNSPCCAKTNCGVYSDCGYFMEGDLALRECFAGATPSCCTNQQCAPNQVCAPLWTDVPTGGIPAYKKAWVLRCQ